MIRRQENEYSKQLGANGSNGVGGKNGYISHWHVAATHVIQPLLIIPVVPNTFLNDLKMPCAGSYNKQPSPETEIGICPSGWIALPSLNTSHRNFIAVIVKGPKICAYQQLSGFRRTFYKEMCQLS